MNCFYTGFILMSIIAVLYGILQVISENKRNPRDCDERIKRGKEIEYKLYYSLKENNLKSKLIMQVHDELIVETEKSELEKVQAIMKDSMENATKLIIPLDIKINKGKSWYDAK